MTHKHKYILDKNNFGRCKCGATKQFPVETIYKLRPSEVITMKNLSSDSIPDPDVWCYASVHGVKLDK